MLVDDITTQGKTFEVYDKMIKDYFKGVEIVKFAFGSKKTGEKQYTLTLNTIDARKLKMVL